MIPNMSADTPQVILNSPLPFKEEKPGTFRMVPNFVLWTGLIAGTAGIFTPTNFAMAPNVIARPFAENSGRDKKETAFLRPILDEIRSTFGLTMTEFAAVFGVSRPAAYAWFSGSVPKAEIQERIWAMHSAAQNFASAGLGRIALLKRKPLNSGGTLLDALTNLDGLDLALSDLRSNLATRKAGEILKKKPRIYNAEDVSVTQHGDS